MTCGLGGLAHQCQIGLEEKMRKEGRAHTGTAQTLTARSTSRDLGDGEHELIIHDMEGEIEIGDTLQASEVSGERGLRNSIVVWQIRCGIRIGLPKGLRNR